MSEHILIVEDEIKIAKVLEDYLHASNFKTSILLEGTRVVEQVKQQPPDLILLDLMLPGKDGLEICREIRQFSTVPIIMLTAKVEEIDRILGLEIGADDYICKPFSPREVVARIKVIFRRLCQSEDAKISTDPLLVMDEEKYLAIFKQQKLDLTPVEFRLLFTLSQSPGKIFSRNQLMDILYTDNRIVTDRTIDSHVKNLRKKLSQIGWHEEVIFSVLWLGV